MRDGGRIEAAIAVLADMAARHKPAHLALKAWGDGARYAGAKDRAFVSGLVLDVLRRRRSLAWMMGEESDRALTLAALRFVWDWPLERLEAAADEPHGPGLLTEVERARLSDPVPLTGAPAPVRGDYPDWMDAALARVFGEDRAAEGEALAARAPVDLRVNTLKTDAAHVIKALEPFGPHPLALAPNALRIPAPAANERAAPVESAPGVRQGLVRGAGRGLADRRGRGRRDQGPPGARLLRRRRRQDPGAGRGHGQLGPALRLRLRRAPPDRDGDAARSGPACATCRSARRSAPTPWPGWRAGWTWCSSTPPAPARAPGGGIRTPSGG